MAFRRLIERIQGRTVDEAAPRRGNLSHIRLRVAADGRPIRTTT